MKLEIVLLGTADCMEYTLENLFYCKQRKAMTVVPKLVVTHQTGKHFFLPLKGAERGRQQCNPQYCTVLRVGRFKKITLTRLQCWSPGEPMPPNKKKNRHFLYTDRLVFSIMQVGLDAREIC